MSYSKLCASLFFSMVIIVGVVPNAHGQLIGSTVNVSAYYPDSSSVYFDPGDRVVSAAVEYPTGSYPSYNTSWQVDVTANQLIITDSTGTGLPFGDATFNGFIMNVLSGPTLYSATVDASSTLVPVSLTIEGGNRLLANFEGVSETSFGSAIINISLVPEPASIGLIALAALALLPGIRKR